MIKNNVKIIKCNSVIKGVALGEALVTKQPISFWGGLNPTSGEIIDVNHELHGENVSDKVFIFPHGRGSSTASAILFTIMKFLKSHFQFVCILQLIFPDDQSVEAVLFKKVYPFLRVVISVPVYPPNFD